MSTEIMLADSALSMKSIIEQRQLVTQAMKDVMKPDQHYGTIPGCGKKPTLLQPGGQLLAFMFRLRPEYAVEYVDFPNHHREVRIICKLIHAPSGVEAGQGLGLCSSMESRYRFRNESKSIVWTDEPVPGVYWTLKNKVKNATNDDERDSRQADLDKWMQTIFQDRDITTMGTKKDDHGNWKFVEYHGGEGKVENENIDDVMNTVLKIAKKRAFVDAIITATASSDMFTQDLEDIAENLAAVSATPDPRDKKLEATKASQPDEKPVPHRTIPKTDKNPAGGQQTQAKQAPAEAVKTWRDTVVHLGDKKGSVYGKRLGDLAELSISTMRKKVNGIAEDKRTKEDNLLIMAIAAHDAEKEGKPAEADPVAGKPCLEMLGLKADATNTNRGTILKVAQNNGCEAKTFDELSEKDAKYMLDNWDSTAQAVKDEQDQLP